MSATRGQLFVTGATGFIGSRLAVLARREGWGVTATGIVRNATEGARRDDLARAGIAFIEARVDDEPAMRAGLRDAQVVVHLAAAQHESREPEAYFHAVNVEGTRKLLAVAREARVRRFVHGSTIGVHGSAQAGELTETSPLAPDNPYGRSKAAAERLFDTDRGFETVIVRISETYGPGDERLLKLFRAVDKGRFVTIGNGRNTRQPIYVDDLCRGLLAAARAPGAPGQIINLAGQELVTTDAMIRSIAAALDRKVPSMHVPLWPFLAVAVVCEKVFPPLGLSPPLHRRRLDFFRKSFRLSTARARALLGFEAQVRFDEGARLTAQWYRDVGLLPAPEHLDDPAPPFDARPARRGSVD